jgi:pSer/pThr/pTyr-binding forkhead associated (FHA) protein
MNQGSSSLQPATWPRVKLPPRRADPRAVALMEQLRNGDLEPEAFLSHVRATVTVLNGPAAGMEFMLDQRRSLIGRGPGVDLALDDPSLAREHAIVELKESGFVIRRSDPDAPLYVNGAALAASVLKPLDRVRIGALQLAFDLEPREERARLRARRATLESAPGRGHGTQSWVRLLEPRNPAC